MRRPSPPIDRSDGPEGLSARLYGQYRAPLMSFFLRRVSSRAEAEDLTQEVFARLIRAGELDRLDNAHAFVFKIAVNLLRDRRRSEERAHVASTVPITEATFEEMVEGRDPDRILRGRQSLADVFRTLDELGPRTRDIFILFRLENMKQREIAALFGLSQSAVEKHVMRAGLHLLQRYGPEFSHD